MRFDLNAKIALQRKIALLLLFSFFSLCFVGWLIIFNKRSIENTAYWINHTHSVIQQIEKINTRISGWESIPQPNPVYYDVLEKDVEDLRQMTLDNSGQVQLVRTLTQTLHLLRSEGKPAAFEGMQRILAEMMSRERDLLSERWLSTRTADKKVNFSLVGGTIIAFLLIFILLVQLNKDIVLRKDAEDKLKENQAWLQSILDNTPSLIYIKDLAGSYVMINRRFSEVLQVQESAIIGRSDYDFCSPEEAEHYKLLDEQVLRTGKSLEIEELIAAPGGDVHLLSVKFPLLDSNGRQIGIGGVATDITERVHFQHQLIDATRDAQEAKKMQELFLANMSHEIRTPMNGIQGMTDLLLDTSLTGQQKEFAAIIKRSASNLLVIINDILDFSKIKAGKLAIEKIDFRLEDVLDNIKGMFKHRMKQKTLQWQAGVDPAIPRLLRGDPYRLNQVLVNLIGNAIKFTEQGMVRVQVTLEGQTTGEVSLLFSISDTGIGIPEKSLPYIFDHFSQGALDITRRYGGTGLGLAITQRLLQLQGGDISVSSIEGKGSTFRFRLAYGYDESKTDKAATLPVIADFGQCLAGKRFLVAEDNEINQQLIDHVLKRGGGLVQLANNGQEAIRYLEEGNKFDLIIMDLQMPVMDGYAATRYIRKELQLPIPIIAMTATAMTGERLRCFEAGMNDYMTKPFEFTEFYKRTTALLDLPRIYPDQRVAAG